MPTSIVRAPWARLACALLAFCLVLCLPLVARAAGDDEGEVDPDSPYADLSLSSGDEGTMVELLQQRLRDLQYYTYRVTGSFGDVTEAALRAFQRDNGLTTDGVFGGQTAALLYSAGARPGPSSSRLPTPRPTPPRTSAETPTEAALREFQEENGLTTGAPLTRTGDQNALVFLFQTRLNELGYYLYRPSDYFNDATEQAIRAFQAQNNLVVDGIVGPRTLSRLFAP